MALINYLTRPEYIFRPRQIYRRLLQDASNFTSKYQNITLPWKVPIQIPTDQNDIVGQQIWKHGICDLSLTEVLWRLLNPGETVIDIGANIGYMTSIMAQRVGRMGKVLCFEPNPEVYTELINNISIWKQNKKWTQIIPEKIALSNRTGTDELKLFNKDRGQGSLNISSEMEHNHNHNIITYQVFLKRLDQIITNKSENIHVVKIDVEGHELEVLQGAGELISKHRIRDIVFEEHHQYPSPATNFLEKNGYTLFRIWKGFWKPLLKNPKQNLAHPWEPPNYLATLDLVGVTKCLNKWGWKSLYDRE